MTSREPPAAGEPPRVGALGVEKSAAVPVDVRAEVDVLLASSAWALDEHEHERYAAFFTEDATYEVEGAVLHGRGEIERRFTERRGERTTRHLCGGVRIVPEDDGSWKVESVWL
ncbi:MAG: nuclear transport factor 2 family protein, partial [Acidimicrobiales bacterium]